MAENKQIPDNKQAEPLPPDDRTDCSSGLICMQAVSEQSLPESAFRESVNMNFDPIGAMQLRKGVTRLGSVLPASVNGMFQFNTSTGTYSQFIVAAGGTIYYLNGSTFTSSLTGLTSPAPVRFVTILNNVIMVDGLDATQCWDGNPSGSGWVTSGNASGAPVGIDIETFQGHVWILDANSVLYWSSVATTQASLTWSANLTSGTQWVMMNPQDGDTSTGIVRYRAQMILFKQNHIYRIMGIGNVDADPWYGVGTFSKESVVETKVGLFFHHSTGFYQYNIYGIVQEISRPVIDFIRAIPSSQYAKIAGWLEPDGDHIVWAIGTVTVAAPWGAAGSKGTTYTNCELRYTISTQTWTHYVRPHQFTTSIRRWPYYNDGTTLWATAGDNAGNVYMVNNGVTDDGTPISYSIIHGWDFIDDLLSTRKTVQEANFCHIGGAGSNVSWQAEDQDPDALNDWSKHRIGQLNTINTGFNTIDAKARKIRFRVWGTSTGVPFLYGGYELINVTNELITFDPSNTQ